MTGVVSHGSASASAQPHSIGGVDRESFDSDALVAKSIGGKFSGGDDILLSLKVKSEVDTKLVEELVRNVEKLFGFGLSAVVIEKLLLSLCGRKVGDSGAFSGGQGELQGQVDRSDVVQSEPVEPVVETRRQLRARRWREKVLAMAEEQGYCYLHAVRWSRRAHYAEVLGPCPRLRDFVSMLNDDDLDVKAARAVNVYRRVGCGFGVNEYHVTRVECGGVFVASFYDCIVAMLLRYPSLVGAGLTYQSASGVLEMPLSGVVGSIGEWCKPGVSGVELCSSEGVGGVEQLVDDILVSGDDPDVQRAELLSPEPPVSVSSEAFAVGVRDSVCSSAMLKDFDCDAYRSCVSVVVGSDRALLPFGTALRDAPFTSKAALVMRLSTIVRVPERSFTLLLGVSGEDCGGPCMMVGMHKGQRLVFRSGELVVARDDDFWVLCRWSDVRWELSSVFDTTVYDVSWVDYWSCVGRLDCEALGVHLVSASRVDEGVRSFHEERSLVLSPDYTALRSSFGPVTCAGVFLLQGHRMHLSLAREVEVAISADPRSCIQLDDSDVDEWYARTYVLTDDEE